MKKIYSLLLGVLVIGCTQPTPLTPNPPTSSMTAVESALIGEWTNDSTEYYDATGTLLSTVYPACPGAEAHFKTNPSITPFDICGPYEHWEIDCLTEVTAWQVTSDTTAKINCADFDIVTLTSTQFVYSPINQNARYYYTKQ